MQKIITVSGNVGSGKTTLIHKISKELPDAYIFSENANDNLYLADFYVNMKKWAYHSRIDFLQQKLSDYLKIERLESYKYVIFDRGFDELQLFVSCLNKLSILSDRDYASYIKLMNTVSCLIKPSDLIIYMHCNPQTSLKRILNRGIAYEKDIELHYIELLYNAYEDWISNYKDVLQINTEEIYDMQNILNAIQSEEKM